ncbi:MAG TPA: glycoside hydrolase family 3 N-terminal domain-containing protein, partial [Ktedonobacteraceae bacterium]
DSDPPGPSGTSIQTDARSDAPPHSTSLSGIGGERLLLPSLPRTPDGPRHGLLRGDYLQGLLKTTLGKIEAIKVPGLSRLSYFANITTAPYPAHTAAPQPPTLSGAPRQEQGKVKRSTLLLLLVLVLILLLRAINEGTAQFIGPQGWAFVIGGPSTSSDPNLLTKLNLQLQGHTTPGVTQQETPQQYINMIINNMSLDQKLGQMMIVQFLGDQYSLQLSTMIKQYTVGTILIFQANRNIQTRTQLKELIQQMQANSKPIPLAIAIDQEGGAVDRLVDLDGARPSEASIGMTNSPASARAAGLQDAQDLAAYGINLNLAPVVDVTRVYNAQLATRTYGSDPELVTRMAGAYLQGLQQSGKVVGTLKHFPGLGDVAVDPHVGVPVMYASKSQLEQIDWAPYRALIRQNLVHAVMVTHEIVNAVDPSIPSTLSSKVVTGILRNELGFQGVIMTDSLSMSGVTSYASEYQAAADAIAAGADIVMGAATPEDVAGMFDNIKQAINNGTITTARIDDSVRRILMMKYTMGLLSLPNSTTK